MPNTLRCPYCDTAVLGKFEKTKQTLTCGTCGKSFNSSAAEETIAGSRAAQLMVGQETLSLKRKGGKYPDSRPERHGKVRRFGDYELLQEIARGGMGVVFKARQVSLNRLVALKMILSGDLASPRDVKRFHAEAEAAASLEHRSIVPIYEVGEHGGQHYFSMKLVEGGSLSKQVSKLVRNPRKAATMMIDVARAVHFAHQQGILHRDLKPGNILVDSAGHPHVTDFGLAKRIKEARGDGVTRTGDIVGTVAYMPPEQASGEAKRLTTAADVYSLGAILYELLTGRPPFMAQSRLALLEKVRMEDPLPPTRINPILDRELDTICLKCLEKEPSKRYSSADALADELQRWLKNIPIQARPATSFVKIVKWTKRHPAVASLILVLTAAAASVIGIGAWYGVRLREQRDIAVQSDLEAKEQRDLAVEQGKVASSQRQIAEDRLKESQHQLGRAFLERARNHQEHFRYLAARLTAARAIGFQGLGGPASGLDELLKRGTPDWNEALALAQSQPLNDILWATSVFRHHAADINGLAYSRDGRLLASFGEEGLIKVWDVKSGNLLAILNGHGTSVSACAFTKDGKSLISSSGSRSIITWNLESFRETARMDGYLITADAAFILDLDPEGKQLRVLSFPEKKLLCEIDCPKDSIRHFSISAQQGLLAVADTSRDKQNQSTGNFVYVWEFNGAKLEPIVLDKLEVNALALSPSKDLLSLALSDGTIRIWEVRKHRELRKLKFDGGVWDGSLRFFPDGRQLLCRTTKGVQVWQAESGELICRHAIPDSYRNRASVISPDGKTLAFAQDLNLIRFLDLKSGRIPNDYRDYRGDRGVQLGGILQFTPDGKEWLIWRGNGVDSVAIGPGTTRSILSMEADSYWPVHLSVSGEHLAALGQNKKIEVWNVPARRKLYDIDCKINPRCLAFSPDDATLAMGYDSENTSQGGVVELWNMGTRKGGETFSKFQETPYSLEFSPDGKFLAIVMLNTEYVPILDLAAKNTKARIPGRTDAVVFMPDSKAVITFNDWTKDNSFTLTSLESKSAGRKFAGHAGPITAVAVSPDGATIASGSKDKNIWLWDALSGKVTARLDGHADAIGSLVFGPDGKVLVSRGASGDVRVWEVNQEKPILQCEGSLGHISHLSFSRKGDELYSRSDAIRVWNARTGRQKNAHELKARLVQAFPSSAKMAIGLEGEIRILDLVSMAETPLPKQHDRAIRALAVSPDERFLASSDYDKKLLLWDLLDIRKPPLALTANADRVNAIAFASGGNVFASAEGGAKIRGATLRIWDVATGKVIATKRCHEHRNITFLKFIHNDERLVYVFDSSEADRCRILDARSLVETIKIPVAKDEHDAIAVSNNGRYLACAGDSGAISVWDLELGARTARYPLAGRCTALAFSPDDRFLAGAGDDLVIRIWAAPRTQNLSRACGLFRFEGLDLVKSDGTSENLFKHAEGLPLSANPGTYLHCLKDFSDEDSLNSVLFWRFWAAGNRPACAAIQQRLKGEAREETVAALSGPRSTKEFYERGMLRNRQNRHAEAEKDLLSALDHDPNIGGKGFLQSLAHSASENKNWPVYFRIQEMLLERFPDDSALLHNFGVDLLYPDDPKFRNIERAAQLLKKSIELGKSNSYSTYFFLGRACLMLGKREEGIKALETSGRLCADDGHMGPTQISEVLKILEENSAFNEAKQVCKYALEKLPKDDEWERAEIERKLGELEARVKKVPPPRQAQEVPPPEPAKPDPPPDEKRENPFEKPIEGDPENPFKGE